MKLNTKQPLWVLVIIRIIFAPLALPPIIFSSFFTGLFGALFSPIYLITEIFGSKETGEIDLEYTFKMLLAPIVLPALAVYYYFKKGDILLGFLKDE